MINIKKYGALKKLKKSQISDHYIGYMPDDRQSPVKIIHFPSEHYNISRCESIKQDIKNIASAGSFFFPKIVEYKTKENKKNMLEFIIVHELSNGIPVKKFCCTKNIVDLKRFFKVAVQLALAVNEMHKLKIRFHGINISDIVLDPVDETVKIISIDSLIKIKEYLYLENENSYDILPYISPEQTGLLNTVMDYRSDFYILGTIFYELLTNQKIYYSNEPEKIINAHIVQDPYTPLFINKLIPRALSDIVMKLLSKDPCSRYQNTCCLIEDIEKCFSLYVDKIDMNSFKIGENRACEEIFFPKKIYGRDEDLQQLYNGFDDVAQGGAKVMLITGFSGTGKTFLGNHFCRYVKKNRGLLIQGEFVKHERDIPYSILINAFSGFIKQILSESNNRVVYFKNRIKQALGEDICVITDVIPDVEKIIGSQPACLSCSKIPVAGTRSRFEQVFKKFILAFADKKHPFVIFCDNIHWIDSESCKLGELIFTDNRSSYIYCVIAGKSNDIKKNLILTKTIEKFQKEDVSIKKLVLSSLNESCVNSFVSDILCKDQNETEELSEIIYEISAGNPLAINQLILNLVSENFLWFNYDCGCWEYDSDKIKSKKHLFNCFDIALSKIKKLSENAFSILEIAVCTGTEFDLKTLVQISKKETDFIIFYLLEIVKEGVVKPVLEEGACFEDLIKNNKKSGENLFFEFFHDYIYNIIYLNISKEKREWLHLNIGYYILDKYNNNVSEEKLYEIVTHLNYGSNIIDTKIKKDELIVLNFICSFASRSCGAYDHAYEYMKKSVDLFEPGSWEKNYELSLIIFNEFAKSAYLAGKYHEVNYIVKTVFDNVACFMDKLNCYETKILTSIAKDEPQQAVYIGLEVLSFLGVFFINDSNLPDLNESIKQTKKLVLLNRLDSSIAFSSKKNIAVMRILSKLITPSYISVQKLYPFIVFKMLELTALFGNFKESAFACVSFGIILTGIKGDFKEGLRFGEYAIYLINNNDKFKYKAKVFLLFNVFIKHWNYHLRDSFKNLKTVYDMAIESGDIEYAAYSAHFYAEYKYFSGINLKSICHEMAVQTANIKKLKQKLVLNLLTPYAQAAYNLYANIPDPCRLTGLFYDEKKAYSDMRKAKDWSGIYNLYLNKMILYYLFENYPKAVECADTLYSFQPSAVSTAFIVVKVFFDSLSRLAVISTLADDEKKRCLEIIDNNQKKMKKWAGFSHTNTMHKFYLVAAEIEQHKGNMVLAAEYYDLAADLAVENMYIQEAALSNERAVIFYTKMGRKKIARLYLEDAIKYYKEWGAETKIKYLEEKYSDCLSKKQSASVFVYKPLSDYNNILKIIQNMSSLNISADDIIIKLMNIVICHFNIKKAAFILIKKGEMYIRAQVSDKDKKAILIDNIPIKQKKDINKKIVEFVKSTHRFIVSNDTYLDDEVIKQPVLCLPVLNGKKIFGIVYIEKSIKSDGFLPDHINFFLFLFFHLGVMLENSMLSMDLNQKGMALRESEKKYRTITENSSELICVFDIKDLRVEYAGGSGVKDLIGYTSSEVQNMKLENLLTQKSMEIAKEAIIKDLAREKSKKRYKNRSRRIEIEMKCKDGSIVEVDAVSSFFRDKDGYISKVIVVGKDNSKKVASYENSMNYEKEINKQVKYKTKDLEMSLEKLKKEQNQLIQTKKMKALGELVAGVAHEINTPMGVGVTASSFLEYKAQEFLKKHSSKTLKEYDIESFVTTIAQASSIVHSNLKRSVNLINDFKQVAVNKSSLQITTFSMKTCIENIILEIKIDHEKTVHKITVNCSDKVKIKSYKLAFSQIFKNFIMNSFIHGFNNVIKGEIEIGVTIKESNMFILYSDNGFGMDTKTTKKIFNPFFTTKRGIGKSGLGMHVVYNLITSTLNGTIFCFSKKDKGTGFFIKIPLKNSGNDVSLRNV